MERSDKVEAIIDTNVLVYDTIEDSVFHDDVRNKLSRLKRWVIPTVVLEEFALVLIQLKVEEKFIKEKFSEILSSEKTEVASILKEHFLDSTNIISKEKTSFRRLNDKLIVSVAKTRKLPIFTYDGEIKREWHKII